MDGSIPSMVNSACLGVLQFFMPEGFNVFYRRVKAVIRKSTTKTTSMVLKGHGFITLW